MSTRDLKLSSTCRSGYSAVFGEGLECASPASRAEWPPRGGELGQAGFTSVPKPID